MTAVVIGLPRRLRFIRFGASKPSAPAVPSQPAAAQCGSLRPLNLEGYADHRSPVVIPFPGLRHGGAA